MNNTSLFMAKDTFSNNKKSFLELFERQKIPSNQDLTSQNLLPSFKCFDFSNSINKNVGSISLIRDFEAPINQEKKQKIMESWKNVPSLAISGSLYGFNESFTKIQENQFPDIFDLSTTKRKESPFAHRIPDDEAISKLLSLKVKEVKIQKKKHHKNFCGDCKKKDNFPQENLCSWNKKVFKPEEDKIHMMRLKSLDSRPDIYIASCCMNKDFLTKVMSKISKFQRMENQKARKNLTKGISKEMKTAVEDQLNKKRNLSQARKSELDQLQLLRSSLEITNEINLLSTVKNVGNKIIKNMKSPFRTHCNVASSLKNFQENEQFRVPQEEAKDNTSMSLLSKKVFNFGKNSITSPNQIVFKSGIDLMMNLQSKMSSGLGSFEKKSSNALQSQEFILGKRESGSSHMKLEQIDELKRVKSSQGKIQREDLVPCKNIFKQKPCNHPIKKHKHKEKKKKHQKAAANVQNQCV